MEKSCPDTETITPSPRVLAAREKRRIEAERWAQVPGEVEPIARRILSNRWCDPYKSAIETILDYRLGPEHLRRVCALWLANDAGDRPVPFVGVNDLPFDRLPSIWLTRFDTDEYQLRQRLIREGHEDRTIGVIDCHRWADLSTALQTDPGFTVWRSSAGRRLRTGVRAAAGNIIELFFPPGLNLLPAIFYAAFLDRVDVDQWIQSGQLTRV